MPALSNFSPISQYAKDSPHRLHVKTQLAIGKALCFMPNYGRARFCERIQDFP
jgi:hypothetical protein